MTRTWLSAVVIAAALPVGLYADDRDVLKDVKDRKAAEAQRVEQAFKDDRAAAYSLVRSDVPRLTEATQKLDALLRVVEADTSLDSKRRQTLVVTLKWDLDKVKEIAAERRRAETRDGPPPSVVRRENPRTTDDDRKNATKDLKSSLDQRKKTLDDAKADRVTRNDKFNRIGNDVLRASIPATDADRFPRDWVERTRMRSTGLKMTAKERAIMAALNKSLDVDYKNLTLSEALDAIKQKTGLDIAVDKRGLDEANVTYDSAINLKLRASARTVIRRLLGDLGLSYYVKDEALQVTSVERARQETTIRTYYIGDLAAVTDTRLPFDLSRLQMIETVNSIVSQVLSMDPNSWRQNNPDAPGTVVFDPVRMTLIVRQTAEFHLMMSR